MSSSVDIRSALGNGAPTAAPDSSSDPETAGRGLESYFLRQILAEVRNSSDGGMLDGGFAGSTFHEMLDGALADSMAKNGGLGIGKMVEKALDKSTDTAVDDPAIKVLQHRSK